MLKILLFIKKNSLFLFHLSTHVEREQWSNLLFFWNTSFIVFCFEDFEGDRTIGKTFRSLCNVDRWQEMTGR